MTVGDIRGLMNDHPVIIGVRGMVDQDASEKKGKYYRKLYPELFSCGGQMTRNTVFTRIFRRENEVNLGLFLQRLPIRGSFSLMPHVSW
jgi:hypothetical protein